MKVLLMMFVTFGLALTGCNNYEEKVYPIVPVVETPVASEPAVEEAVEPALAPAAPAVESAPAQPAVPATPAVEPAPVQPAAPATPAVEPTPAQPVAPATPAVEPTPAQPVAPATPAVEPAPVQPVTPAAPVVTAPSGDAVAGASKAGKCKVCHTFDAGGKKKTGPNLFGVYGKVAGKTAGFKYGNDLKAATFSWDDAALAAWVCDSKSAVKSLTGNSGAKTKMPKQKVCGTDALNVAAYLKTLK